MKTFPLKYIKESAAVGNADDSSDAAEETAGNSSDWWPACARSWTPFRRAPRRCGAPTCCCSSAARSCGSSGAQEAWAAAREAFDLYMAEQAREGAAQACDILFLAEQPQSLAALGQGIWLAVTYPVDPELSVALLQHVVDETPPDADGAAVAAVTAHYLVDLRARDPQREHLLLYTNQLLATVARRHSGVDGQEAFNRWIEDMELNDPAAFLPRLRNVVDVLVQDEWWFDRDALQAALPAE